MKRILLTLIIFFICGSALFAQKNQGVPFNGMLSDFLGNPVKKAKIYVDKNYISQSDKKGRFGLTDVKPTDTLKIVYQKKIYYIPVDGKKSIKIKLADQLDKYAKFEAEEDQDLVGVGFGYVKRRESLDISNGISGDVIRRTNATNVLEALIGLVPGMSFYNINGQTRVTIRGLSTNSDKTDPLFLVDNVEVDNLNSISIESVENVEVLKDGSMYGAKGANGVIIVRTRGNKNKF